MASYASMQKQLQDAKDKIGNLQQKLEYTGGQLNVYKKVYEDQSMYIKASIYQRVDQFNYVKIHASHAQFAGDLMPDNSNRIQIGDVQGDVSGITGSDISGTVTNTIGQLEASPESEALQLADLLKQLQTAITREDSGLSQKDQEKALKYIDILGKLGNDRQNPDLLEKAEAALDALPTIAKRGAGLIEFAEKHLPTITSAVRAILGL
jgi:CHAD domain-containing protein